MKIIFLLLVYISGALALEVSEFDPEKNSVNLTLVGPFAEDSRSKDTKEYKYIKLSMLKIERDKKLLNIKDTNYDDVSSFFKTITITKKGRDILSAGEEFQKFPTKLSDLYMTKDNQLEVIINFIGVNDKNQTTVSAYRTYKEAGKLPVSEYITITSFYPKKDYADMMGLVKFLILSKFQVFDAKERKFPMPTTIEVGDADEHQYKIITYIQKADKQKYFLTPVTKYNYALAFELGLLDVDKVDSGIFSDKIVTTIKKAEDYCNLYGMILPDNPLLSELGIDSFSGEGVYSLENKKLKIYVLEDKDTTNSFICVDSGVERKSVTDVKSLRVKPTLSPVDKVTHMVGKVIIDD